MTEQTTEQSVIVEADRKAIKRALFSMPYAGGLPGTSPGRGRWADDIDVPMLLSFFEALTARLHEAGDRARANERELDGLRRQRAEIRRFLGTAVED